jgi:DNA-binding NarL/FixJ family response regulator
MLARKPTTKTEPIRVLIADDHLLFTEVLEAVLSGDPRIEVAGCARDGGEAVALAEKLKPDLVLMDVSMPGLDGIEATREIRAAGGDTAILMLSGSDSHTDVDSAREAGASGYVTKDRMATELVQAIVEVAHGRLP